MPELKHYCPSTPVILVGTKLDVRADPRVNAVLAEKGQPPISTEEGAQLAKEIGAHKYCECSAKEQKGLKQVFDEALRVVLAPPRPKKPARGCLPWRKAASAAA